MVRFGWLCVALTGCNGDKDGGDDSGIGGPGGGGGATSWTDATLTGTDPVIRTGVIHCEEGSDTESGYIFFVEVVAADPQGAADLRDIGGIVAGWAADGSEVFSDEILVCDDDGDCYASFRDGVYGAVTCATADMFSFTVQAIDKAGNWSDEYPLTWLD